MTRTCPRCRHGSIVSCTIRATDERAAVCDECEAAWLAPADPSDDPFSDLGELLLARDLAQRWSELDISERS